MTTSGHRRRKKARAQAARASRRAPGEAWRKRLAIAEQHFSHMTALYREADRRWMEAIRREGRDSALAQRLAGEMDALYRRKVQAEILAENVEKELSGEEVSYRSPFYVRDAEGRRRRKRRHAKARVRRARRRVKGRAGRDRRSKPLDRSKHQGWRRNRKTSRGFGRWREPGLVHAQGYLHGKSPEALRRSRDPLYVLAKNLKVGDKIRPEAGKRSRVVTHVQRTHGKLPVEVWLQGAGTWHFRLDEKIEVVEP